MVAVGGDPQDGSGFPTEVLAYTNDSLDVQILDFEIGNFNGTAAPRTFDMFLRCAGCIPFPDGLIDQPIHNYNTPCSSVSNNSDAGGGVVSLGAIDAADPGLDDFESFSSCGPTNDGRIKPDAAAVDGVAVTGNGGFGSPFFGTSAAAPHAAGIAALLLECNPSLSRAELRAALLDTAVDLGPPGTDNEVGAGRVAVLAAVLLALDMANTCPWDLDNSGSVGTSDLLELFAQWGTAGAADFDESGAVGTSDLLILFANWGPCP